MTELNGVALVGMAGRWPGARNIAEFWANLVGGVESISFFTREELADAGVPARVLAQPGYVGASAVLRDVDRFDASFFGFTPREAALLDPQGRLFMECVWEAIEDAGHLPDRFDGLIGVFGGVGASRYFTRNLLPSADRLDGAGAYQAMIANDKDFIPAWVSYKLNLRGPSVAVQTSCSTSLVAVHMACQSLLTYQCDMAVAGGVSLALDEKAGYVYQDGGILSPDGHCRPFDARAKGTVHGSGAGVVVLRRLDDAVAEGDAIVAVLRGSAINNDGAVKVGFTAPGVDGQADVIGMAHAIADIDPDTIGFVEAHGTATPLGDPVEVAALTRVFRRRTARQGYCALGSVKSNVGHLDAAAGVTGLIKAALSVERGRIPPTLHFEVPNPQIDLASSPFYVNPEVRDWPAGTVARRAGVSSFGIGGTNAHVVLEQAPPRRASGLSRAWQILAISAETPAALETATDALADAIDLMDAAPLADAAYTLLVGRKAFRHRRVVVCREAGDGLDALDARDPARVFTAESSEAPRPITLMFPGQGSQHVDMGRDLYAAEPAFRTELDRCAGILRSTAGLDLLPILFPAPDARERAAVALGGTDVGQLALFSVEFALARMLMAFGVSAQSFIGHSIGEYVAACLSGVFTLEDALSVVAARGRLMAEMPPGDMMAVSLSESSVKAWIDTARLSVAVVNSPTACVVAGPADAVADLATRLEAADIPCRRLQVSHAFHSHMMDAALPRFREVMSRVPLRPPLVPFVSNVTGTWIRAEEATDPEYWVRQLRRTVYFADGLGEVLKDPHRVAVEVGPGRTLQALALQQRARGSQQEIVALLPDVRDSRSGAEALVAAIGRLWLAGAVVDWTRYYEGETRNRVHLPTYPFERERHWIDPPTSLQTPGASGRQEFAKWFFAPVWKQAPISPNREYYDRVQKWLIVGDESGLGVAIADALGARGQDVTALDAGDSSLVAGTPDRVVCFPKTFGSALRIVQAVAETAGGRPRVLEIVQTGVQAVTGDEASSPEHAAVLGLCRVAPQEIGEMSCRHIDVVAPNDDAQRMRLVGQLLQEFALDSGVEAVAYRGRLRWILEHARVSVPAGVPSGLRKHGVYWITGGTGGIGLSLAEHLAATYQARLLLTSRRGAVPDESTRQRIRRLEELGSDVRVIQADATDAGDMLRVAEEIRARYGDVHGVIHAAGVPGGRLVALETAEGAAAVMAAKVIGAINLEQVLDRFHPDFVMYCSSLGVQLGGLGQAAYVAANAVLDAMARDRSARADRLTVSVNWDRWRDVGMAAAVADADAIAPLEGARALEVILALGLPQVAVSTLDLRTRAQGLGVVDTRAAAKELHPRPALTTDYVRPTTGPEIAMAGLWQDLLGLGQVGIDDNFFALGGDSLTALRMTALYRERTGVSLPVTALYAAPTIRRFLESVQETTAIGNDTVLQS